VSAIHLDNDQVRFSHAGDEVSEAALLREIILANFSVSQFASHSQSLEDVFMAVTRGVVQ
jgi:ABC-2 type transport system ATP-binding protein